VLFSATKFLVGLLSFHRPFCDDNNLAVNSWSKILQRYILSARTSKLKLLWTQQTHLHDVESKWKPNPNHCSNKIISVHTYIHTKDARGSKLQPDNSIRTKVCYFPIVSRWFPIPRNCWKFVDGVSSFNSDKRPIKKNFITFLLGRQLFIRVDCAAAAGKNVLRNYLTRKFSSEFRVELQNLSISMNVWEAISRLAFFLKMKNHSSPLKYSTERTVGPVFL